MPLTTAQRLEAIETAIDQVLSGAQEYTIGDYTCKRPSLSTLYKKRDIVAGQLDRELATGSRGPTIYTVIPT